MNTKSKIHLLQIGIMNTKLNIIVSKKYYDRSGYIGAKYWKQCVNSHGKVVPIYNNTLPSTVERFERKLGIQ